MGRENAVLEKSMCFAIRIVKLYKHLTLTKKEFVLSKQLLRSGTSIGANIREAVHGQSKKDFVAKMSISLKEAAESEYWLELMYRTEYLADAEYKSIIADNKEILKLLTSIIKSAKQESN